jgi:hypothetical protein
MIHPDGTGVRRVIEDIAFDQSIAWSPDGEHLAFVRYALEGEGGPESTWPMPTVRM